MELVTFPALADGYPLGGAVHAPADMPRAVVVVAGAMAVKSAYYGPFADWLAGRGFAVLTFDYRGVGRSRPQQLIGFDARLLEWGEKDLGGALAFARTCWPERRLLVVCHSVGGQVLGLAPGLEEVSGALFVASQGGSWRHWDGLRRAGMWALWRALPRIARLHGYVPGRYGLGEDLPVGVASEWARWGRQPEYLMSEDTADRRARFARFEGELEAMSFADDHYAPRRGVAWLVAQYTGARVRHQHLDPAALGRARIGHFGFFRRDGQGTLWPRAAEILESFSAG